MKFVFILFVIIYFCSCTTTVDTEPPVIPIIHSANASNNMNNALSAFVTLTTTDAVSASVEVLRDSITDHVTPSVQVTGDSVTIPILGLHPNSRYTFKPLVVSRTGHTTISDPIDFTTDSLPSGIPQFTIVHADSPTVKYIMLGIAPTVGGKSYAIIIDTNGHTIWYRAFSESVIDFQKQPNGHYTAWSSTDETASYFHEFDALGTIVNTYRAAHGLETGPHELRVQGSNHALFGIEYRIMDLTSYGGLSNAEVKGIVVEYHRSGQPTFLWNTFDHFSLTDGASDASLTIQHVNTWHGNAIEIDHDDNLLVSFRNSDEITKINSQTGDIIWRLGGKRNQFTFLNDDLNGFSHQHGIRRLPNGNIILFDNGNLHSPPMSRAVEYRLDETNKIAELVWEYRPDPLLFGFALGFAQRLPNGNTLICFGTAQRIIEVDPGGRKRWEIAINEPNRFAYRAFSIESLY